MIGSNPIAFNFAIASAMLCVAGSTVTRTRTSSLPCLVRTLSQ